MCAREPTGEKGAEWEAAGTREGPAASGARQGQRRRRRRKKGGRGGDGERAAGMHPTRTSMDGRRTKAATRTQEPR